jgi:hypothetical protein
MSVWANQKTTKFIRQTGLRCMIEFEGFVTDLMGGMMKTRQAAIK